MMGLESNFASLGSGFGGSMGGNASMGFNMPVMPAHGGSSCIPYPVMMGNGNNNGAFGGDGIWGLLLASVLLGRGGFGGNNCCDNGFGGGGAVSTLISDNMNGRFGALSDQITGTAAAGIAATHNAAQLEATRDNGAAICGLRQEVATVGGIINTNLQAGFGNVALESCRDTGVIVSAINSNANALNANITQVGTQGLIAEMRTQAQISSCCCETNRNIDMTRCEVLNAIHMDGEQTRALITANTIQDLRDKNQNLALKASQFEQNSYLTNYLCPRPVPSTPVYGNSPIFQPVVSANGFCGFGGSSFGGNNNGCGC